MKTTACGKVIIDPELPEGQLPPLARICGRKYIFGWELPQEKFYEHYHPEKLQDCETFPWFRTHVAIPGCIEQEVPARAGEIEPGVIITGYDRIARLFLSTNRTQKELNVANDSELVSKFMKVVGIVSPPPRWIGMRVKWGQESELPEIQFDPAKTFN
ncbi:hypothetical protein BDN72DRAFT_842343 [Pluteus cervinus]|uniref:Uncharacterized protein n=1 Tax=Pluteus cervinus TaxID=181527 RepID=A0ACD3AQZ6_9AGAR|nr:hypothetical protein BDN72DRAFT_842343 [Pluteus cervinus]